MLFVQCKEQKKPHKSHFLLLMTYRGIRKRSVQTKTLSCNIFCLLFDKKVEEGLLCAQFRGVITQPYFHYRNLLKTSTIFFYVSNYVSNKQVLCKSIFFLFFEDTVLWKLVQLLLLQIKVAFNFLKNKSRSPNPCAILYNWKS